MEKNFKEILRGYQNKQQQKNQHTEYLWTITPSGKKPIYQLCTSE